MKPDEVRALPKKECVLYTPYYGVVRELKSQFTGGMGDGIIR